MASKTTLPIARLRALGCRVGTLLGHWPTAPVSPNWQYSITLPASIAAGSVVAPDMATTIGAAKAIVLRDGRIAVRAFAPGVEGVTSPADRISKADREKLEADVAGLLSAIADALNGR